MRLGEADGIGRFAVEHAHLGMRQIVQLARGILPGRLVVGIVNCLCDHVLAVSYPAIITRNGEDSANLPGAAADKRSEEHTSELQSLMRISYAVFCLKKKQKKTQTQTHKY